MIRTCLILLCLSCNSKNVLCTDTGVAEILARSKTWGPYVYCPPEVPLEVWELQEGDFGLCVHRNACDGRLTRIVGCATVDGVLCVAWITGSDLIDWLDNVTVTKGKE